MVSLKNPCIVFTVIVYYIKAVSSLILDLSNLSNSVLEVQSTVEDGIVITKIYSTPEKKITEIYQGFIEIWIGYPGESAKCVTYIKFKRPIRAILKIEVDNPVLNSNYYLFKKYSNYKYISKDEFEKKYEEIKDLCKSIDVSIDNDKPKRLRKHKPKIKDTDYKTRKSKKKSIAQEKLDPEETDTADEIPSDKDDDEPEDLTEEQRQKIKDQVLEKIDFEVSSDEDIDVDGPTHSHIQSDAITQTETQSYERTGPQVLDREAVSEESVRVEEAGKISVEFSDDEIESELFQVNLGSDSDDEPLIIKAFIPTSTQTNKKTKTDNEQTYTYYTTYTLSKSQSQVSKTTTESAEQLVPETIPVEIGSDEEDHESEISDIELLFSSDESSQQTEKIAKPKKPRIRRPRKQKPESETEKVGKPKRKRGRPRKLKPDEVEEPKRKRARPKKHKADELDTDHIEVHKQVRIDKRKSKQGRPKIKDTEKTTKQTTEQPEHLELQPETIPVEIESDDEHEDIDLEQELLNEPLFGEDVEKLLERELDNIGISTNELDSVFEEKSKDDN
ncbi:Tash(AT)-like protein, putative [Theileria annulata]|uniref:SuAT1 DNA binding protein n=1 Tax=Theileria annulata TaxID=5874 RepID=Q70B21_THEAN|nr:Tash(AT)-like protein, putative [Theileria annulata]CAE53332.1 SuAT1 DNA binding protein [Theileria annulata]CAI73491.1 Tash(AT)-like protein, putative [Theileria annulata]|eukprot:XP_954168.1 Tash(AT)-like protein, putative [Theileria annulata]